MSLLLLLLVSLEIFRVAALSVDEFRGCVTVPEICPNINVTYWLYTRLNEKHPQKLDITQPETISSAPFVLNQSVKILIHGYTGWKDYSPNTEIRPALLQYGDYNVISVDYSPIVKEPCYLNAVKNVKVIANCTARLIDYLVDKRKIALRHFHVIGFSLGAHVSGLISEFLQSGLLPLISGLDPAFPLFWGNDVHSKLDKSDGQFVDVVHTNALIKGKLEKCGHVDFYCNGGSNQPGCDAPQVENVDSCNHARAPAYYAESITSETGFWGKSCSSWYDRNPENCKWEIMGYHTTETANGSYFVTTNSAPPFARGKLQKNGTLTH